MAGVTGFRLNSRMSHDHDTITLPDPSRMPKDSNSLVRWLIYFISPYQKTVAAFLAYRTFRYTYFALMPAVIGLIIDAFNTGKVQGHAAFYLTLLFGYFAGKWVMLFSNLIFYKETLIFEKASRALTIMSVRHLTALPLDWHEARGSGGKLQQIMNARKAYFELGRVVRWSIIPVIGSLIGAFVSVVTLDAPLFFMGIFIAFVTSYLYFSWYIGKKIPQLFDKHNERMEKLLSGVYEFVSAIRTVKAFSIHHYIDRKAYRLETIGLSAVQKVYWTMLYRWSVINFVGFGWIIIIGGLGFYGCYQGWLSTGAYATLFFVAITIWTSLEGLAQVQDNIFEYNNGLRRLIATLKTDIPALDIEPLAALKSDWKNITFDQLSFVYSDKESQGVHDVSFPVKRGEKIAFVGSSGAGKTTLAKLLMKQMLPQSGAIRVDGINLSHIPSEQWLGQIGFVPQDVELFNLSIRENILIDRDDVSEDFYQDVLKQSALSDFIAALPEGDATIIGERGIKLSGGQRQRLGIARALIRNTPIMVFDEATSSLDSLSEQQIQQAIDVSFAGRTVFLIAHRLSTVRYVDKIVVLEKGHIIEQGSFDDLIAQNGMFAKLWSLQSR